MYAFGSSYHLHSFLHSFNRHLCSIYYVLSFGCKIMNKTDKISDIMEFIPKQELDLMFSNWKIDLPKENHLVASWNAVLWWRKQCWEETKQKRMKWGGGGSKRISGGIATCFKFEPSDENLSSLLRDTNGWLPLNMPNGMNPYLEYGGGLTHPLE